MADDDHPSEPAPPGIGRDPGPDVIGTARTIVIERVEPELDGGRYPAKRVQGDWFTVSADIIADGHDQLGAALLIRADDETEWQEIPMRPAATTDGAGASGCAATGGTDTRSKPGATRSPAGPIG